MSSPPAVSSRFKFSFLFLLLLSGAVSFCTFVLATNNIVWLYNSSRMWDSDNDIPNSRIEISSPAPSQDPTFRLPWRIIVAFPQSFNPGSLWAFFVTGLVGTFDFIPCLYLFGKWKNGVKRTSRGSWPMLNVLLIVLGASVFRGWVVVVYGWLVERSVSPAFEPSMITTGVVNFVPKHRGTFSFNRWVCSIVDYGTPSTVYMWRSRCQQSWAYMVLGTILLVISMTLMIMTVVLWVCDRTEEGPVTAKNAKSKISPDRGEQIVMAQ